MVKKAQTFFSEEEKERIRREVAAVESQTAGEVATMVVDRSDNYCEAEVLASIMLAALLAVICAVSTGYESMWIYIPLVFALFLPAKYLTKTYPKMGLPFVGRRRLQEAVRDRAKRAFFERGLYRTKDETGILIFISLLERKVWILGDRGINAKIPPEIWQALAVELATGIRESRACESLCSVIAKCGKELGEHFPRKADDINELPDDLIVD